MAHRTILADEDLEFIRSRRRARNQFGFALQLCALRFPGRLLTSGEMIPEPVTKFLAAAQGAEVRDFPVQPGQTKEAFDEPSGLPEGHAEQHLHCETNLDRGIAELGLTPPLACRRRMPRHLRIKPD